MKLLMESWRSYLKELENTSEISMPKKFYISIRFSDSKYAEKAMADLGENQVEKVLGGPGGDSDLVGFSDSPTNFMQFHGESRGATIVMPAQDFLDANEDVVKVEYDNIDFLTQDGLKIMFRLLEKNQNAEGAERIIRILFGQAYAEVTSNILKQTGGTETSKYDSTIHNVLNDYPYLNERVAKAWIENIDKINDLNSFTEVVHAAFIKWKDMMKQGLTRDTSFTSTSNNMYENAADAITKDVMKEILKYGIIHAASGYKEENEWVVDSNILNIPSSSILYVAGPTMKTKKLFQQLKKGELPKEAEHTLKWEQDKMKMLLGLIEKYGLEKKYKKIIITDMGTFNQAKKKWRKREYDLKHKTPSEPYQQAAE